MKGKIDFYWFVTYGALPIILVIVGILIIIFRRALGNANYKIKKLIYSKLLRDEKGKPGGLFKFLTPNFLTMKYEDKETHQKWMLINGIIVIFMGIFLFIIIWKDFH